MSPTRSAKAAKRFLARPARPEALGKACHAQYRQSAEHGAAITELKREGKLDWETAHRQVKYLNNVIEADHGKLKILIAGARFQIDPHGLCHDQGIRSHASLRKDRLALVPAARHQGRGAPCGELLALGPSALTEAMGMLNHHFAAAA
ncbi:transposase [Enterobacter roggenkampii]